MKEYKRNHYLNNKPMYLLAKKKQVEKVKKWLIEYKSSNCCTDCKSSDLPNFCYEFDHLRDKSIKVSKLINWSIKRVKEEIEKCELVCRNCHKDRTYKRSTNKERTDTRKIKVEKRILVDSIKSQPCTDCNNVFPFWIMEMDHVRGEKRYDIRDLISSNCSVKTLKEELLKCEVVCGNCHAIRSNKRLNEGIV